MSSVAVVALGDTWEQRIAPLRAAGHDVTIVTFEPSTVREDAGGVERLVVPSLDVGVSPGQLTYSYRLYRFLKPTSFDVIVFDGSDANAYCAARARQLGLAFPATRIAIHSDGPVPWRAESERRPFLTIDDVRLAACQRLEAELADVVIAPAPLFAWMKREGWALRGEQHVETGEGWIPPDAVSTPVEAKVTAGGEPSVTVVVAHHERPALLLHCMAGLARQTYRSLEVVVVDDGSASSEAKSGLDEIERRGWPWPLRILREPKGGVDSARNAGWRAATTDLIVFLDDDDVPFDEMVETLVGARSAAGVDLVGAGTRTFRGEGAPLTGPDDVVGINLGHPYEFGLLGNQYGGAVCLWPRALLHELQGFRYGGMAQEDGEILARATLRGATIAAVPEPLYWHRQRPGAPDRAAAMREGWAAFASWPHSEAMPDGYKLLPFLAAGAYWEIDRRDREQRLATDATGWKLRARLRGAYDEGGMRALAGRLRDRLRRRR